MLQGEAYPQLAFGGAFIVDAFSALMKTLTYLATAVVIIMARSFMQNENLARLKCRFDDTGRGGHGHDDFCQ